MIFVSVKSIPVSLSLFQWVRLWFMAIYQWGMVWGKSLWGKEKWLFSICSSRAWKACI